MMKTVIHYGKDGKAPIRSFQEKRADMALQTLKGWTAGNLKQLKLALANTNTVTAHAECAH